MTAKDIMAEMNRYIRYMKSVGKTPSAIYLKRAQISKLIENKIDHTQYDGIPIKQASQ
jgi:hypothetical protein